MAATAEQITDRPVLTEAHRESAPHPATGYKRFEIGSFKFERDEYFARIQCPTVTHVMDVENFMRSMVRDVAWGFFYGWVNFDEVFGTVNNYDSVDVFMGAYNQAYKDSGTDFTERFEPGVLLACFKALMLDWTNAGFNPFAAPLETGSGRGPKNGNNDEAVNFQRELADRFVSLPGDTPIRSDENGRPVNRQFADVDQSEPEVHAEAGFEGQLAAFNLFKYLSRSPVTWNPSIVSIVRSSAYCPTSEEHILPLDHGNDRVEWFIQMSDEITWRVADKDSAAPMCMITMKAGDVSCMPADIRHRGFCPKRSMLLVWENLTPGLEKRYASGELPPTPASF